MFMFIIWIRALSEDNELVTNGYDYSFNFRINLCICSNHFLRISESIIKFKIGGKKSSQYKLDQSSGLLRIYWVSMLLMLKSSLKSIE